MEQFNINTGSSETFVAFHGTGGNEYSLIQIIGDLNPNANIISLIGDVGEGKSRRFNLPLENGQLNREDFQSRIDAFYEQWQQLKPSGDITMIGYSNGANFILGLLEKDPHIAHTIILLKATNLGYTFESGSDARIIMTAGARDMLSIAGESLKLSKQLQEKFPNVTFKLLDHGHELPDSEIDLVKAIYNQK